MGFEPSLVALRSKSDPSAALGLDLAKPGLATGAASLDDLVAKLEDVIPELLELNGQLPATTDIHFVVHAERRAHTSRAA